MIIKWVLLVSLLLYSVVSSQSFSYLISLRHVQQEMDARGYIAFRKLTDKYFRARYSWVVYACILCNGLLVMCCALPMRPGLFTLSIAALMLLMADMWIAIRGNLPVNRIINSWTTQKYPENWFEYRCQWLKVYSRRQVLNILGFCCLLVAAVFF